MSTQNKYKYIHIMYAHDDKFVGPLIRSFNEEPEKYRLNENLFVTPFENVYEKIKKYKNVILDSSKCNLYKKYSGQCTLIISHGMSSFAQMLTTSKSVKNKILYRYWGGSRTTHYKFDEGNFFINIYKRIKFNLFKNTLESFAGIGISNSVDKIDLNNVSKNLKYYPLPYDSRYEWLEQIYINSSPSATFNVLLGHRGKSEGNHIELLDKLTRYIPNIKIYVPLSYGDSEYIQKVTKYVSELHSDNIEIISEFMPPDKYALLLSSMHIGIFDGVTSYALGNISMMLEFCKTIYLNEKGVIAKAFKQGNVPYKNIANIGNIDVNEFMTCFPDECFKDLETDLLPVSKITMAERWSNVFNDFS